MCNRIRCPGCFFPNLQAGTGLSVEHLGISVEHLGSPWSTLGFQGSTLAFPGAPWDFSRAPWLSLEHLGVSVEHLGFLWSTFGLSTCQTDTCQTALGYSIAVPWIHLQLHPGHTLPTLGSAAAGYPFLLGLSPQTFSAHSGDLDFS